MVNCPLLWPCFFRGSSGRIPRSFPRALGVGRGDGGAGPKKDLAGTWEALYTNCLFSVAVRAFPGRVAVHEGGHDLVLGLLLMQC